MSVGHLTFTMDMDGFEQQINRPQWLSLEEVGEENLDRTELDSYRSKSDFIEQQVGFPVSRCYLNDFIIQVFERGRPSEEPFEERGCERYMRWREEENAGLPHDSYEDGQFVYNPIVFYRKPRQKVVKKRNGEVSKEMNVYRLVLKDDWGTKDWLQHRKFALMAPITYVGKSTANKNARYLYAFAIDLDGVGLEQLQTLFLYMGRIVPKTSGLAISGLPLVPLPNIIVNSGHGLHLYYTLRYPLALFEENAKLLQQICKTLYKCVGFPRNEKNGEPGTTTEKNLQCLGIYHLFRLPETNTKALLRTKEGVPVGEGVPIEAWTTEVNHYTIDDFLPYIKWAGNGLDKQLTPSVIQKLERGGRLLNPNRLTLRQAREKYGEEWFENRDKPKGRYTVKRRLYDWWLAKLKARDEVTEGHRYYCIMALTAFAVKCDIPFEELKEDAYSLINSFDLLTSKPTNHFRKYDVDIALKAYEKPGAVRWSRAMIERWTAIKMARTKRNKRDRATHLARIRVMQEFDDPSGKWRGRPKATIEKSVEGKRISEWIASNPGCGNKAKCAREVGLSRPTVYKWWKAASEAVEAEEMEQLAQRIFLETLANPVEKNDRIIEKIPILDEKKKI